MIIPTLPSGSENLAQNMILMWICACRMMCTHWTALISSDMDMERDGDDDAEEDEEEEDA